MILGIDIGNTSTHLGFYEDGVVTRVTRISSRVKTIKGIKQELAVFVKDVVLEGACISSVVPAINSPWYKAVKSLTGHTALFVSHTLDIGIPITYEKPQTIGADRLANACAAAELLGTPVVVADTDFNTIGYRR